MAPFVPHDPWQEMRDQARWDDKAACRDAEDPGRWDTRHYPNKSLTMITEGNKSAMDICTECPVMLQCLEHGIRYRSRFTIRGGMTDEERDAYTMQQRHLRAVS